MKIIIAKKIFFSYLCFCFFDTFMVWIQDPDPKTTKMSDLDPQQRTWFRIPKLFLTWGKGTSSTWICTQTPITWGAMSLGCQSPLLSLLQESTT